MDRRRALLLGSTSVAASLAGAAPSATAARKAVARTPFISRPDGTQLYCQDWGSGEPVLMLHSAGVSSRIWTYQLPELMRAGLRCVAYDRRGHGRSTVPGTGYDYDTLADDLAAVIEALELRGITLIGHSMGCGEIVRYLTRHGASRIRRIALLAPTLPYFLKTADNPGGLDQSFFESMRREWQRDYPAWAWQQTPAFFAADTSEAMQRWGFALGTQTDLHAILQSHIAVTETDFRAELQRVGVPTLILHGTQDKSCPLAMTGKRTAELVPGARLVVIDGAPHGLLITHADRVNDELLRWCQAGKARAPV